jgi:uncharacterized protein (DUF433 family)
MDVVEPATLAPVYPLPFAARLVGLDTNTARRWVQGYDYAYKGERRRSAPIVSVVRPEKSGIAFADLLTLRLVRAFRDKGLGLPTIRRAAQIAAEHYDLANPFITKAFRSDGVSVFLDLQRRGDLAREEGPFVNALTGQHEFRSVVEPSLFADVVFLGDYPSEWFPQGKQRAVVIRPDRVLGAPHVAGTGVRTDVIADTFAAEGGDAAAIAAVAAWFKLTERQVRDACEAEQQWRIRQAA